MKLRLNVKSPIEVNIDSGLIHSFPLSTQRATYRIVVCRVVGVVVGPAAAAAHGPVLVPGAALTRHRSADNYNVIIVIVIVIIVMLSLAYSAYCSDDWDCSASRCGQLSSWSRSRPPSSPPSCTRPAAPGAATWRRGPGSRT